MFFVSIVFWLPSFTTSIRIYYIYCICPNPTSRFFLKPFEKNLFSLILSNFLNFHFSFIKKNHDAKNMIVDQALDSLADILQCNTVLEMDHLRSRLLSRINHNTYFKINCTKIMEHELVLVVLLQEKL